MENVKKEKFQKEYESLVFQFGLKNHLNSSNAESGFLSYYKLEKPQTTRQFQEAIEQVSIQQSILEGVRGIDNPTGKRIVRVISDIFTVLFYGVFFYAYWKNPNASAFLLYPLISSLLFVVFCFMLGLPKEKPEIFLYVRAEKEYEKFLQKKKRASYFEYAQYILDYFPENPELCFSIVKLLFRQKMLPYQVISAFQKTMQWSNVIVLVFLLLPFLEKISFFQKTYPMILSVLIFFSAFSFLLLRAVSFYSWCKAYAMKKKYTFRGSRRE